MTSAAKMSVFVLCMMSSSLVHATGLDADVPELTPAAPLVEHASLAGSAVSPEAFAGLAAPVTLAALYVNRTLGSIATPSAKLAGAVKEGKTSNAGLWFQAGRVFDAMKTPAVAAGIIAAAEIGLQAVAPGSAPHGMHLAAISFFGPPTMIGTGSGKRPAPTGNTTRKMRPGNLFLKVGSPVFLVPDAPISSEEPNGGLERWSAEGRVGQVFFQVARDVVVDDMVAVRKGTKVEAVVHSIRRRANGMPGEFEVVLKSLELVDGQKIPLAKVLVRGRDWEELTEQWNAFAQGRLSWLFSMLSNLPGGPAIIDRRHPLRTITRESSKPVQFILSPV